MNDTLCPRCQHPNGCAMADNRPAQSCWCMQQPIASTKKSDTAPLAQTVCFCEKCLQEIRQQQAQQ